jgi:signal transduction histidine kinase
MLDGLAGDLTGTQRGYEEIVLQSGRQMRTMLDALVDVTRLENGTFTLQPAHVSMSDAIADAIERCREKADAGQVSLWSPLKRDLPLVVADPDRLRQILGILLDNAIRCTPAGGAVVVHVRSIDTDPDALGVDVADSGSGIEPTRLARIFDRVYETLDDCRPSKALGLGLCICRHLVALHGGRTWVRSTPGRGSTFSFTVPVAPEELLSGGWPDPSLAHGRPA